jgi:hypothetical protein
MTAALRQSGAGAPPDAKSTCSTTSSERTADACLIPLLSECPMPRRGLQAEATPLPRHEGESAFPDVDPIHCEACGTRLVAENPKVRQGDRPGVELGEGGER